MAAPKVNKERYASYIGGTSPVAPTNTVLPVITGTAKVGSTLTATTGTFAGTPTPAVDRQWYVGGVAVIGAFATTYVPVVADIGKTVTVRARGQSLAGNVQVISAATAAVVA